MVKKATIRVLDMLMKKGFQLININPKQVGRQRATLFNPDSASDELRHSMTYAKTTKDGLI